MIFLRYLQRANCINFSYSRNEWKLTAEVSKRLRTTAYGISQLLFGLHGHYMHPLWAVTCLISYLEVSASYHVSRKGRTGIPVSRTDIPLGTTFHIIGLHRRMTPKLVVFTGFNLSHIWEKHLLWSKSQKELCQWFQYRYRTSLEGTYFWAEVV